MEPDYTQLLSRTIQLHSGRVQLRTLAGDASFIVNLPDAHVPDKFGSTPHRQSNGPLLSRRGADIVAATLQIERTLIAEGGCVKSTGYDPRDGDGLAIPSKRRFHVTKGREEDVHPPEFIT